MADLIGLVIRMLMLPVGFVVGGFVEKRHLRDLDEREQRSRHVRVTNLKRVSNPETVAESKMVTGHVVVATDYYKSFATQVRNFFGGEMGNAMGLMLRARREALARLVDEAEAAGADEVWNVRFAFSNVGAMRGKTGAMQVELLAWGTAVRRRAD